MTLTRANVESILVKRCGPLLTAAGMAVTYAGANADLNDPIGYAIRRSGGTVASIVLVADADVATVADADTDQLLDIAELRSLKTILGNLDKVDTKVGQVSQSLSQLADQVKNRIADLQAEIAATYGVGSVEMETGSITLDFADHNEMPLA